VKKTRMETAQILANGHFRVEPNIKHIFLLESSREEDDNEPIKLLEVVEGTIELGIEPISFTPDPTNSIEFPSLIVEVSPREYKEISSGKLDLKAFGWVLGKELLNTLRD